MNELKFATFERKSISKLLCTFYKKVFFKKVLIMFRMYWCNKSSKTMNVLEIFLIWNILNSFNFVIVWKQKFWEYVSKNYLVNCWLKCVRRINLFLDIFLLQKRNFKGKKCKTLYGAYFCRIIPLCSKTKM